MRPLNDRTGLKNTEFGSQKQNRVSSNAEERLESRSTKAGVPANTGISAFSFSDSALAGKLALEAEGSSKGLGMHLLDTLPLIVQADELRAKTERKRRSVSLSRRIALFDERRAERMANCGRRVSRIVSKCEHKHTVSIRGSNHFDCQDRLCPECARKRSARLVSRLSEPLRQIQTANGLYASFVTLTLKNTESLPVSKDLIRWKKKVLKSKFWDAYGLYGTLGSLEVKIGEGSGLWHVHFHLVCFTEKPVPTIETGSEAGKWQVSVNQELSEAWTKANEGNGFIIRGVSFDGNYAEVLKYISKGIEFMSDEHLEEFCKWSHRRRFVFLTGKLFANPELKTLLKQAQEEQDERREEACQCPECGCVDYERQDFRWNRSLDSYVLERVSDFVFPSGNGPPSKSDTLTARRNL